MKIHHIGIASRDINKSIEYYEKIHNVTYKTNIIFDELQNCYLAFLKTNEGINIEFILGKQVEHILNKNITYHHICYEVIYLKDKINEFIRGGALQISPPQPAKLFQMRKVVFLYTQSGLIELLEETKV